MQAREIQSSTSYRIIVFDEYNKSVISEGLPPPPLRHVIDHFGDKCDEWSMNLFHVNMSMC